MERHINRANRAEMKCPYCGDRMQMGFVQCRDGVYWTPRKQWVSTFAPLAHGAIPLGKDDKLMKNSKADAFHCGQCKAVIIVYGEERAADME